MYEALQTAAPPVKIHVDNQAVLDGVELGRAWCTSSRAAEADLWRSVWDQLDQVRAIGPVEFKKVKAHTSWMDLLNRVISPKGQFGNWLADLGAKACTKASEAMAPASAFESESRKATAWLSWAARCAASWIHDTDTPQTSGPRALSPTDAADSTGVATDFGEAAMRHELWTERSHTLCRRCGLQWEGLLADPSRFPSRCTGSAAGRAAANATGNLNYIWAKNVHSRRELIQRGSRLLSAEPPPKWLIDPASIAEVMDDLEQRDSLARLLVSPDGTHDTGPLLPPWLRPPSWLPQCLAQPWEEDMHVALPRLFGCSRLALEPREKAHRVAFMGSVAFCARCACFAHKRFG